MSLPNLCPHGVTYLQCTKDECVAALSQQYVQGHNAWGAAAASGESPDGRMSTMDYIEAHECQHGNGTDFRFCDECQMIEKGIAAGQHDVTITTAERKFMIKYPDGYVQYWTVTARNGREE